MSHRAKVAAIILVTVIAVAAGTAAALLSGDRVYPGVHASGADLSHMSLQQAERRIGNEADDLTARKVTLRYAGESSSATLGDLGAVVDISASAQSAWQIGRQGSVIRRLSEVISARRGRVDLPLVFQFHKDTASRFLSRMATTIDRQPASARPIVEDGALVIRPEKTGIRLNGSKSLSLIADAVNAGQTAVDLVVEVTQPEVKVSDLAGIDGVISTYSTPYNAGERDRTYNLRLAGQAIDGTLLRPGEEFSYNKIVGPRDRKYGFRDAKMFVEGQIESGTGGGVCQVSTTVYNAALLANLQIVRRSHHSRPVVYAPVGRDATVAPSVDLKFRNNTDTPLYISAIVADGRVRVTILGRKIEGREVEVVASGHSVLGARTIERVDSRLEPGKRLVAQGGRSGHRVTIYRVVKDFGEVTSRELISNDYYAPESRIISVSGPADP